MLRLLLRLLLLLLLLLLPSLLLLMLLPYAPSQRVQQRGWQRHGLVPNTPPEITSEILEPVVVGARARGARRRASTQETKYVVGCSLARSRFGCRRPGGLHARLPDSLQASKQ
jgi:hypothetical protein